MITEDSNAERLALTNYDRPELEKLLVDKFQEKPYRAKQLFKWIYRNQLEDFSSMTDISKPFREKLAESFYFPKLEISTVQQSTDGTIKFLFKLPDGSEVESVLIAQAKRYTLCVSSQVGCAIGCTFCRTALMGLKKSLPTSEIVGQAIAVLRFVNSPPEWVKIPPKPFSNVVFMGMGEPLHNADNVSRAANILTDDLGLQLATRKVTLSTSGLVPKIRELADKQIPVSLAVSLNATHDEQRNKLIPINKKWPISELKEAMAYWAEKTGRHVTVEYVMLSGVNDTEEDLARLPGILHGFKNKLNLIPYNAYTGLGFDAPTNANISHWQKTLASKGINTRVRWSKGADFDAACGQLATNKEK